MAEVKTITVYKIRSAKTGLFSKGGNDVSWGKVGKVWKRKGDLSSHFTQLTAYGRKRYQEEDAYVHEYVTTEIAMPTSTDQWIADAVGRAEQREADSKAAFAERQRKRDLAEYERLKRKIEGGK